MKTGLILNPPHPKSWHLGSGKARARFGGELNPTGDWSDHVPLYEPQSRDGFDPQSCADEHTLRAYITLARYLNYDFIPDASERYTGAHAGTTAQGTDPYQVAESIRKIAGVVPQEVMPWTDQMTFEDYYDKWQAWQNLPFGRAWKDRYVFGYEWVFSFGNPYTPEEKSKLIETALKRGTVCVSVSGNYRFANGKLTKDRGEKDSHWVLLSKKGEINDSYTPQVKQLVDNYDHNAAMVYFLKKQSFAPSFWQKVIESFILLWHRKNLGI